MSHPNAELIARFYTAFAALDEAAMAECYGADANFQDEVFLLRGRDQLAGMWRMLCAATRAKGRDAWSLTFSGIEADDRHGKARWDAHYRFSATGRLVHNVIAAEFEFRDGRIVTHRDRFNFWRWSRQALGVPGWLLGGTSLLRRKVQAQAAANLRAFLSLPAGAADR
jgi:ketosteroid isomerase-like protein